MEQIVNRRQVVNGDCMKVWKERIVNLKAWHQSLYQNIQ
jgi:hypothetical protein